MCVSVLSCPKCDNTDGAVLLLLLLLIMMMTLMENSISCRTHQPTEEFSLMSFSSRWAGLMTGGSSSESSLCNSTVLRWKYMALIFLLDVLFILLRGPAASRSTISSFLRLPRPILWSDRIDWKHVVIDDVALFF